MKVTPLRMAEMPLPEGHPAYPGEDEIYAFLVEHSQGPVLVDTGIGEGNEYIEKVYAPTHFDLTEALKGCGVKPADIFIVINSHLHFDHCGNNQLFPDTRIYAGAAEIEDAREKFYTVTEWFDYEGVDLVAIDKDLEILPGLTILHTPGHTRGHISVLVKGDITQIIAAQAIYTHAECVDAMNGKENIQPGCWNDEAYIASRQKLFDLKPQQIYMSHDHRVWED